MPIQPTPPFDLNSKNTTFSVYPKLANTGETRSKAAKRMARPKRPTRAKESSSPATPLSPKDHSSVNGGTERTPRLRKASFAMTKAQVRLLIHAIAHTQDIGYPFNRFVTIDWELASVIDPWKAQGKFLKYIRDWTKGHGQELSYVWIMERGSIIGLHSHMLLHIPLPLISRFIRLQHRWLKKSGVPRVKGVTVDCC